jgi:hypothetical protein
LLELESLIEIPASIWTAMVELYHCSKMACSEFANFNNSGELMLTERPKPLRLMIQGGGSAGKQIVGEKRED